MRKPKKKGRSHNWRGGKPALSSEQRVMRQGHIAARLREEMDTRRWGAPELAKQLGLTNPTSVYNWISGNGAPTPENSAKLAALFRLPISEFTPRDLGAEILTVGGSSMHVSGATPPVVRKLPPIPEVFQFTVTQDGMARIKLDVTLPVAKAIPLFGRLAEAGLLPDRKIENAEDEDAK